MSHANARLTPRGRRILVERIASGWPVARAARAAGISRQTGSKWWNRYRREGLPGLVDRRSRVHRQARALDRTVVDELCRLRRQLRVGPHRLAWQTGLSRSTIYAVLRRQHLSRLDRLEPRPRVLRYERAAPGELVTSTPSRWAASAPAVVCPSHSAAPATAPDESRRSAGTGSTSRSTTTAVSPTSRSWPTRRRPRRSASCAGRWPSTLSTASASSGC